MNSICYNLASKRGHEDIVNLLIESGANLNTQDYKGETPLHKAMNAPFESRRSILRILTKNKADISIRNENGKTPLEMLNEIFKNQKTIDEYINSMQKSIHEEENMNIQELLNPKSQICLIL